MLKGFHSKTRRQKWLVLTIAGVLVLVVAVVWLSGYKERNPIDRGPVFLAVEETLSQPGPARDDLIKRGLFTWPAPDGKGGVIPGEINFGEVEKLVEAGVYAIDEQGHLTFGPAYSPPP